MNLCEILGFQPKGVATLSFSSRKRPAYAGNDGPVSLWMPGQVCNDVASCPAGAQCGVARPLPLWIADQVRYDGVSCPVGAQCGLCVVFFCKGSICSWLFGLFLFC